MSAEGNVRIMFLQTFGRVPSQGTIRSQASVWRSRMSQFVGQGMPQAQAQRRTRDIFLDDYRNSGEFKNIKSSQLLCKVDKIIKEQGYKILNIDSTVILEYPHIGKYTDLMVKNISKTLKLELNQVSVKATTNDGLGFIGERKGISVITTSLVIKK